MQEAPKRLADDFRSRGSLRPSPLQELPPQLVVDVRLVLTPGVQIGARQRPAPSRPSGNGCPPTIWSLAYGERVLVARVVAKLELGGAQLSLLRVARALAARGHQTRLLAGNATPEGVALAHAHGFQVEVMGSGSDLQWTCEPAFAEWLAPRLLGVDLIHAHMLGAWWATATVAVRDVPLIASEHNGYEWNQEPPWAAMADVAERIALFYAHGPNARAGALRVGVPGDRIRR